MMRTLLLVLLQADVPAPEVPEYVLKALFLLNFAKYVEWPPGAFENPSAPFFIGVLGRDPFGEVLEATLKGKLARGRPVKIRRFGRPRDVADVHILFVPRAEEDKLPELLERPGPVLLVGESERFCRLGGALSVLIEEGRPRLEANPRAAARADLTIDAKLLKVASVVRSGP